MKLLALDQATLTGWAVLDECGSVTESGVWKLADPRRTGESRGMRYVRFRSFLRQTLDKYQDIRLIVHEQTLLRGGAATEIANGLKALILEAAAEREIDVTCVHTSELKRFATGNGRAEKQDMMETCLSRFGIMPLDDNHSDAILIGFWGLSTVLGIRIPENELHAKQGHYDAGKGHCSDGVICKIADNRKRTGSRVIGAPMVLRRGRDKEKPPIV